MPNNDVTAMVSSLKTNRSVSLGMRPGSTQPDKERAIVPKAPPPRHFFSKTGASQGESSQILAAKIDGRA